MTRTTLARCARTVLLGWCALGAGAAQAPTPSPRPVADQPDARQARAKGAQAPRGNPALTHPEEELARLRLEGLANFEAGITLKSALPLFEAALALQPGNAIDLFNLGSVHFKLKHPDEARSLLERAATADPRLAQPAYVLALLEKAAGNADAARAWFEKARGLAPDEPAVHYQLAALHKARGDDAGHLQALTDVLALDPFHTGALYQMHQHQQRVGNAERAQALFREFSRLKRAATFSRKEVNYEEGRLVLPLVGPVPNSGAPAPAFAPRFAPSGLSLPAPAQAFDLRDVDGDGLDDVVALLRDGRVALLPGRAQGGLGAARVLEAAAAAPALGTARALRAESLVADGSSALLLGSSSGLFQAALDVAAGRVTWRALGDSAGADAPWLIFDADHDGDLDCLAERNRALWINRGNGDFFVDDALLGADVRALLTNAQGLLWAPLGNGDGVDLLVWTATGARRLVRDAYGGRYEPVAADLPALPGLRGAWAADLDNDGRSDLVSWLDGRLVVEWNRVGWRFERGPELTLGPGAGHLAIGDFDNDAGLDLAIWQPERPLLIALNPQGRGELRVTPAGSAALPALTQPPLAADVDADGRVDLVVANSDGQVSVWRNESAGVGHFMKVRLQGMRSAPSGLGTRVEMRLRRGYQRLDADGRLLHLGLGQDEYAQVLRITWPNGFVENKFKVDAGASWTFKESERVSGSCPTVFAWDGRRFSFVTDAFVSGPMGVPMARGRYFPVDHDEYLKIDGRRLAPRADGYAVRITEELREANYFDQVRLLAVDHPRDVAVFPNERLGPFPPSSYHIFGSGARRAPLSASDQHGQDQLAQIAALDGRYARNVEHTQYTGLAQPHWIVFELPDEALRSPHLRLFLTGWFYYFESRSLIGLSQRSDVGIGWPEVQAEVAGSWQRVELAGIPPGKHKTLVLELGGKLPAETARLRVWTNLALYWDAIQYDSTPPRDAEHTLREIPLRRAELRFRGFSQLVRPAERSVPEHFEYDEPAHGAPWNPLAGRYTRYGDVTPLLRDVDSRLAVFGSGDELALIFGTGPLPAPQPGQTRDFLLYVDGFVKDGDGHTAHGGTVEPLPFAGMPRYPYDASDLGAAPFDDPAYQAYLAEYQTRPALVFTGPPLAPGTVPDERN